MQKVKENDTLRVHYTGTLENGDVFDSSIGGEPLEFTLGKGMLIPGFEAGVIGMAIDETKKVNIPAAEAYGEHSEEFIEEISREILPAEITPEVGMQLMQETPEGQQIPLLITAVSETTVTLDANHPLAGKALTFEIKVVGIN